MIDASIALLKCVIDYGLCIILSFGLGFFAWWGIIEWSPKNRKSCIL